MTNPSDHGYSISLPPSPGTQLWVKAEDKRWWPAVVCKPHLEYDVPFLSFVVSANIGAQDIPPDCAVKFYGGDKIFPINSTHIPESIIPLYWAMVITKEDTREAPYISLCCPAEVCHTHSYITRLPSDVFEKVFPSQLEVKALTVLEKQIELFSSILASEGRATSGEVQSIRLAFNDFCGRSNFVLDPVSYPAFEQRESGDLGSPNMSSRMEASTQPQQHSSQGQRHESLTADEPLASLFSPSDLKKAISYLSAMHPADAIVAMEAMGLPPNTDLGQMLKDIEANDSRDISTDEPSIATMSGAVGSSIFSGSGLSVTDNGHDKNVIVKKEKKTDRPKKKKEKRKRPVSPLESRDHDNNKTNAAVFATEPAIPVPSPCDSPPLIIQSDPWDDDALHHLRYSVFDATM
eukprot:Tbor_TRINITY_DN4945_c0_g2::TRINITY_DN4945_c0_g2_i1::g.9916::m.9916